MIGNVYVLFGDKGDGFTKTFYKEDKALFQKLNSESYGIYCTVNDFDATDEELKKLSEERGKNVTKRNIPFLKKINGAFADLDIAKKGDKQTPEQKTEKKANLLQALINKLDPSIIIETSNGLQPIRRLKNTEITMEYQNRYVNMINGIIERSKTVGASGDQVKDVTRVLRMPGYYHMKEEPFMCNELQNNNKEYTLEEMEEVFSPYIKKETKREVKNYGDDTTEQYRAIDGLDFQEVIIKAFASVGRSCEFDKQNRLIIDGRLTGTFQGKNGDKEYLASTSHEPFQGNKVTAVADILNISTKEAYKRLIDRFNIPSETELSKKKPLVAIPKQEYNNIGYVYPNSVFDYFDCFMNGELVTIVAESNSGKTTFAMDILQANSLLGKRGFYINLEFDIKTMWRNRRLFINGKKKRNLTDLDPLTSEEQSYMDSYVEKKLKQFDYFNEPNGLDLKDLVELIIKKKSDGYSLFVVDTFSRIHGNLDANVARTSQNKTMEVLQELVQSLGVAIILLHHTNRKGTFEGSQKIMDLSNVFIIMTKESDGEGKEYRTFSLSKDKYVSSIDIDVYYKNQEYFKS